MRYNFFYLVPLTLLLAAGCTGKEQPLGEQEPPQEELTLREIRAGIADIPAVKSITTPFDGKSRFAQGDAILVSNGEAEAVFVYNASRDVFYTQEDDFAATGSYSAVYPADYAGFPGELSFHGHFAENLPMQAPAAGDNLTFSLSCAVIGVETGQTVEEVVLSGNGLEEIRYTGLADGPLWLAVPAGTYPDGLLLTFRYEDGQQEQFKTRSALRLESGVAALQSLTSPWDIFHGGSGTEEDPYVLATAEDFEDFVQLLSMDDYADRCYVQSADIILPGDFRFEPADHFSGTYDGGGHVLSGLTFRNTAAARPAGLFRETDGARIRDLHLKEASMFSDQLFLGGFAGKASHTVFENCSFEGTLKSIAKFAWDAWAGVTTDKNNHGFVGGIAAWADGCTFTGCVYGGQLSAWGKHAGGIAGYLDGGSLVEDCAARTGSEVYTSYHCSGGIAGAVAGGSTIRRCSVSSYVANLGFWVGGITGYLQSGTIGQCSVGSRSDISCRQYNVGGIVGAIQCREGETALVEDCFVYSDLQGQYNIGGITGCIANVAGSEVTIRSSAYIGGLLYATGTNGNRYNLIGGIAGWVQGKGDVRIEGCTALPGQVRGSIQNAQTGSDNATTIGGVGGLVGFKNQSGALTLSGCYSTLDKARILVRYADMNSYPSFIHYGSVYGGGGDALTVENCFYDSSFAPYSRSTAHNAGCMGLTVEEMSGGQLLTLLGAGWEEGVNGYPLPRNVLDDPDPRPKDAQRVCVIGDSISTFAGYIPAGYAYHYPSSNGAITRVSQTYWYQVIYDHMKNARLDLNMSYSGAAVARSTNTAKSSNHWYENCYTQRYIRQGGCGHPDVVLIHGGTNDYYHNDNALYPGDAIHCQKAPAPTEDILATVFAPADAATTYEEAVQLEDTDFCSAYVKLIRMLQTQYPGVKIVCVIGDCLSEGIEKSTLAIAAHYGAKVVDLLAINGFNDQVYMPKHEYNGNGGGCHPNEKAMQFISQYIYDQVGAWMEN